MQFNIYNNLGKQVWQKQLKVAKTSYNNIELSDLSGIRNGVYHLQMIIGNQQLHITFIKP